MGLTATATTTSTRAPTLCSSYHHQLLKPTKEKLMGSANFFLNTPNLSSNIRLKVSVPIQASNSQRDEEERSSVNDTTNGVSQEDLNFLWKLGAGSTAGAAVIKYGSILFPEITRPNILLALIMVSTPVIIAIVLLIKQSRLQ